jgi:hypothetical protein
MIGDCDNTNSITVSCGHATKYFCDAGYCVACRLSELYEERKELEQKILNLEVWIGWMDR